MVALGLLHAFLPLLNRFGITSDDTSARVSLVDPGMNGVGTLRVSGSEGLALAPTAPYTFQSPLQDMVLEGDAAGTVTLATQLADGLEVVRDYEFLAGHYDFATTLRLTNRGSQPVSGRAVMALVNGWSDERKGSMYEFIGPSVFADESLQQEKVDKLGVDGKSFGKDASYNFV